MGKPDYLISLFCKKHTIFLPVIDRIIRSATSGVSERILQSWISAIRPDRSEGLYRSYVYFPMNKNEVILYEA